MAKNIGVGLILLLFALSVFVVYPTANEFSNCFAVATGRIQQAPVPPQIDKETFCKDGQEILLSLDTCIQRVKGQSVFAPALFRLAVFLFGSKFESAADVSNKHNRVCPEYPAPQLFTE